VLRVTTNVTGWYLLLFLFLFLGSHNPYLGDGDLTLCSSWLNANGYAWCISSSLGRNRRYSADSVLPPTSSFVASFPIEKTACQALQDLRRGSLCLSSLVLMPRQRTDGQCRWRIMMPRSSDVVLQCLTGGTGESPRHSAAHCILFQRDRMEGGGARSYPRTRLQTPPT
jgi:hypothetical protein